MLPNQAQSTHSPHGNMFAGIMNMYRVTQKNGNFWKTQQKLKKFKKKNLLTEIEPLQLAF